MTIYITLDPGAGERIQSLPAQQWAAICLEPLQAVGQPVACRR